MIWQCGGANILVCLRNYFHLFRIFVFWSFQFSRHDSCPDFLGYGVCAFYFGIYFFFFFPSTTKALTEQNSQLAASETSKSDESGEALARLQAEVAEKTGRVEALSRELETAKNTCEVR